MANYKEAEIVGSSWTRCVHVNVVNRLNETPFVEFNEEKVVILDGKKVTLGSSECRSIFDSVSGVINIRNPDTGELTGTTSTHTELYTLLYSLYIQTALERDSAVAPTP